MEKKPSRAQPDFGKIDTPAQNSNISDMFHRLFLYHYEGVR
jgi:hypothetical protein